jgi:hypothetical protein
MVLSNSMRLNDFHDALEAPICASPSKPRGKLERVAELIDSCNQPGAVGVQLHSVGVPHWQLSFPIPAIRAPSIRLPSPALPGIDAIELAFKPTGRQVTRIALEVAVDVVRVVLVLDERAVNEDLLHAHSFQLPGERSQIRN